MENLLQQSIRTPRARLYDYLKHYGIISKLKGTKMH